MEKSHISTASFLSSALKCNLKLLFDPYNVETQWLFKDPLTALFDSL
jgi:hypothetical protein